MSHLRSLPKVELHRHLEGSVRFATLQPILSRQGLIPTGSVSETRGRFRVNEGEPRSLRSFLGKFDLLFHTYVSRDVIEQVAREAAEDAAADGVVHLELRFSPVHFARKLGADPVEVAGWIIRGARRGAGAMSVRFIVTIGRHHTPRVNEPALEAALAHQGDVVGLDVAGPERFPLAPFAPLLRRGARAGLGITLHAGEARGPDSVREALKFGASRLGHGVRAVRDGKLMGEIRRRGIAFECCLTSNYQTGAVRSRDNHPLPNLLRGGHRVTINTDDPQVCGTDLVREFNEARRLGLNARDLDRVTDYAVESAFLTSTEREQLRRRIARARRISE